MRIGQVARKAGVRADTIRFYERVGVLPRAPRHASGYRSFTEATVERILFAKSLQSLGFALDEVVSLLREIDAGTAHCAKEQPRFAAVLARIDERLDALRGVRRRLVRTISLCKAGQCPLLDRKTRPRSREQRA